ncbi:ABC transporter permease subunit [Salininema proteolyticum]|uniref:ABC transporter permease subunit n=1 Tax=Salininema proteolyticum TaxID=1607685 RepID=A0ABV8TUM6_9ACTN
MSGPVKSALARVAALAGITVLIGAIPWLAHRDPALTVLRALYPDREPDPEALAEIRADLGLDRGPLGALADWLAGLLRGDLGTSWVTGRAVGEDLWPALGTSLVLMGTAILVALAIAAAFSVRPLRRAATGHDAPSSGIGLGLLVSLPEFAIAALGVAVFASWLGWLPAYGYGSADTAILPALALGIPAGGVLSRLCRDGIAQAAGEEWVRQWRSEGIPSTDIQRALAKRALPPLVPQVGVMSVALTGGAVAVETVFAVPGLGREALRAAEAQDLPALQAAMLILVLLGFALGAAARLGGALWEGRAAREAPVAVAAARGHSPRAARLWFAFSAPVLAAVVLAGAFRDPDALHTGRRLAPPSAEFPLGTDQLGRDVLARIAHGAAWTIGAALIAAVAVFLIALALGFAPRLAHPLAESLNSFPMALAGVLVAVVLGRGQAGAVIAVALVSWPPLAVHAASLARELRRSSYMESVVALGAGRGWIAFRHTLPALVGPLSAHAAMRLPGIALGIASLGFLGLGAGVDSPEWGTMLSQTLPYVDRAPLSVLAPVAAMAAFTLATLAALPMARRLPRPRFTARIPTPRKESAPRSKPEYIFTPE